MTDHRERPRPPARRAGALVALLIGTLLVACGGTPTPPPETPGVPTPGPQGNVLVVLTHDSWQMDPEVLAAFEAAGGVTLEQRALGDAGEMLSKVILARQGAGASDAALGDVLYGVDNTLLSRALEADIFEAYEPPSASAISSELQLDDQWRVTPIDFGDVCLNYDREYFSTNALPVPQTLEELAQPAYRGLLVVENPNASSPGLAFLMATIAHFGEDGFIDYWRGLKDNDVKVVEDWTTAYYTDFSGSSGRGPRPLVVSYASSPPAEVVFAPTPGPGTPPVQEPPTAAITAAGTCFRQVEYAGILRGATNRPAAEQFIEFMLGREFQEALPLNMFVFPVDPQAQLPDVFRQHARLAESPAGLAPEAIEAGREQWLQAWTELMLR